MAENNLLTKKAVDLSNLKIQPKKQEIVDPTEQVQTPAVFGPQQGTALDALKQTGKDFETQVGSFGEPVEEKLPTFQIGAKKSIFDTIADKIIPQASAEEDTTLVEEFIKQGQERGLDRETIKKGYELGKAEGRFEIKEAITEEVVDEVVEPEIKEESFVDMTGRVVGEAGEAISETAQKFKFDSNVDDGVIESGLKFLANLPGNTVQLAGDIITVASDPVGTVKSVKELAGSTVETLLNKAFLEEGEEFFTTEERKLLSESLEKEMGRIANEPGRVKELLVENPTDVLLTITGGLGVAKNVAKGKNLTGLVNKIEKLEKITNPIKIQSEALKLAGKGKTKAKSVLFPEKSLDDLVLEISQGEKKNIAGVKKALGNIDSKDIKTYEDLDKTFGDKITEISNKQNELLPGEEIHKVEDLITKSKGGTKEINFVQKSLDDLDELYKTIDDIDGQEQIQAIKAKENLSVRDLNDIARQYNVEFGNKAFGKTGDPLTSVNAQSFENTRKGLKNKSRELMPDDTVKTLDSELSNLYDAKNLSTKMIKNVDNVYKKVVKRGLGERLGRVTGQVLNFATAGGFRGLMGSLFQSNLGSKTMNAIGIQDNLAKNLKRFDKLIKEMDGLPDKKVVNDFSSIIKDMKGKKTAGVVSNIIESNKE